MVDTILENPLGVGLGYKTQSKFAEGGKLAAFDNGLGEVFFALGIFGGLIFTLGIARLLRWLYRRTKQAEPIAAELGRWAFSLFSMSVLALVSAYFLGGTSGVVSWMVLGVAMASLKKSPIAFVGRDTAWQGPMP